MKIFGKSLSEYVSFEKEFLILTMAVGMGRLILSLSGVPNSAVKFVSLTAVTLLGLFYYSVTVYTRGFGSYKQLLPVLALQAILSNLIIIFAIVLSNATGKENIFSAHEYGGGSWGHVRDMFIVMIVSPFVLWGVGCLIMLLTKLVSGRRQPRTGTAGA
jgi:hypothetical protein